MKKAVCCAAHCLAERYAVPDEAMLFLGSLRERMTSIALNGRAYVQTAELAAASGGNYDAVIGQCFLKSQADVFWCCVVFVWELDVDSIWSPRAGGRSFGCVGLVGRVWFSC